MMETFVQPKVTGYRQLTEADAALMNEAKALAIQFDEFSRKVRAHVDKQFHDAADGSDEKRRLIDAEPLRWVSIARTDFQTGTMALVRAVAQPTSF